MSQFIGLSFLVLFVVQGYGLEDPSPSKMSEYRSLVAEWAESAKRIIRSLEARPQEEAEGVSSQLSQAMEEGRRQKRSPQDLQNVIQGLNEGLKQIMKNVTSSSMYQEIWNNIHSSSIYKKVEKIGENLSQKGKEWAGALQEQFEKLQSKTTARAN